MSPTFEGVAADVNFRKITKLLVCGRVSICRAVFGDTLNEGRDPDRGAGPDRYTSRFFLKHNVLEQVSPTYYSVQWRSTWSENCRHLPKPANIFCLFKSAGFYCNGKNISY